jgi:hypothetical protein
MHCNVKTEHMEGLAWLESNDSDSRIRHNFLISVSQRNLQGAEGDV